MLLVLAFATALGQAPLPSPPLPPIDSPPLVRVIELRFPTQGNTSLVDPQTYLYYIKTAPSRPSQNVWVPYDPEVTLEDFKRLWATGFLDDLSIDVSDEPYPNGVAGKHITFILEERQRVKIVEYEGSKAIERSAIEDKLKEASAQIRLDTFIDASLLRKTEGIVREMLKAKGFQHASVTHRIEPLPGGPKLVRLTFALNEGPKVRIEQIQFTGNSAIDDGELRRQMKHNTVRPWWLPSLVGGARAYQEEGFEEDADRLLQHYRDRGFVTASIGNPRVRDLRDSPDGKTRFVALDIPVVEGERYRVGDVTFSGNTVLTDDRLAPIFPLHEDEFYSEKRIRQGLQRAREMYGTGGYFEFTGYPDLRPRDGEDVVDVVMEMQEGPQYFVNTIRFTGNVVTRDNVVRRELGIVEGGVFNTEALQSSIRRLNQLGYFKPLELQKHVTVDKTPETANRVDVTFKVEEQNRNQINFGAGLSQYEGLFGNLSYTTANLIGRGESLTLSMQKGSRTNSYQLSFTEPYLFNRPILGGLDFYSRKVDYYLTSANAVSYSEVREGSTASLGWLVRSFTRAYINYTYEITNVAIADDFQTTASSGGAPVLNLFAAEGRSIDSRVTPTLVHNTVDNPIMPHRGKRLTIGVGLGAKALRGTYDYVKPDVEAVWFLPVSRRTGFGFRAQGGWLRTYGTTRDVPYYLRYFLGGETQIRGVNFRTVGPVDSDGRAIGGNKYALFNGEYYVDVAGPVRALLFHDAGQAFSENQRVDLRQLRTSSGVELRVFMPVLNVPFRLIWSWNKYRDSFQPQFAFKFAVGTTF